MDIYIALFVFLLGVALIVGIAIYSAGRRKASGKAKPAPEDGKKTILSHVFDEQQLLQNIRGSFKAVFAKRPGAPAQDRRGSPWVMLLGEQGSGKTTLARSTDAALPLDVEDEAGLFSQKGCNWWPSRDGVVLDIAGELVLRPDGES